MLLERATAPDIPMLHALIESAYRGDSARRGWTHEADLLGGQRVDAEGLAAMLADGKQHLLVHRANNAMDGCIAVTEKDSRRVYIGLVTVAPDCQGKGLGRGLLEAAEIYAASELSAHWAEMTVISRRAELIAWYERRGYCVTRERRPFPRDPRFGLPKVGDLEFIVLEKRLRLPSSGAR